jgi:hypothetical protein
MCVERCVPVVEKRIEFVSLVAFATPVRELKLEFNETWYKAKLRFAFGSRDKGILLGRIDLETQHAFVAEGQHVILNQLRVIRRETVPLIEQIGAKKITENPKTELLRGPGRLDRGFSCH